MKQQIKRIALNKLTASGVNVRTVKDEEQDEADVELKASIKANGLLQSLVVHPTAREDGAYGVVAGARRLRAMLALAEDGDLPADFAVPCLVIDEEMGAEASLAENAIRQAMHPADMAVAIRTLVDKGATPDQIADRFGVPKRTIQRNHRLGSLAEPILEEFKAGRITYDHAAALATTDDTELQVQTFERLIEGGNLYPRTIMRVLDDRATLSTGKLVKYVGLEAYRKAGGRVEDMMFEEGHRLLDRDTLEQCVTTKLERALSRIKDRGKWRWLRAEPNWTYADQDGFERCWPARAPFTVAEEALDTKLQNEVANLQDTLNQTAGEGEEVSKIRNRIAEIRKEQHALNQQRQKRDAYTDEDMAISGVIATVDHSGKTEFVRGLVHPDQRAEYNAIHRPSEAQGGSSDGQGIPPYSKAVRGDLAEIRRAALARAIAGNPEMGMSILAYTVARIEANRAIGGSNDHSKPVNLEAPYRPKESSDKLEAHDLGKAALERLPMPKGDQEWATAKKWEDGLEAFVKLGPARRRQIGAWGIAHALMAGLGVDDGRHQWKDRTRPFEYLVRIVGPDFEAILSDMGVTPWPADLLWGRLSKAQIVDAAGELPGDVGEAWLEQVAGLKKADLAKAAEEFFPADWMPPGIRWR